ncbi:hypothetical protein HU200_058492 [Digitaria exilis]|uniref:Uncharacterized protein n=1 Tax=Digitaria exilis TaxID=1010633 RepID=A0A835E412_9POAL|nr:hypothetical protein HU200_058492 [Digitaria exilis]
MQDGFGARPTQPAVVQTRCKWIIGDVTEVFDRNTWKLGKILKMLNNNYFVIRLADCIQPKEFHISSLRIPHGLEAPQIKPFPATNKHDDFTSCHFLFRPLVAATANLLIAPCLAQEPAQKRKAAADASHHPPSKRAHPRNVVAAAASMADSYLLHSSSQAIEDAECSVASCSVNDQSHLGHGERRAPALGASPTTPCPRARARQELVWRRRTTTSTGWSWRPTGRRCGRCTLRGP